MNRNLFYLLLTLLCATSIQSVFGVVCNGNELQCYGKDTTCYWNYKTSTCSNGVAPTCEYMYHDYFYCIANTTCHLDMTNLVCATGPPCTNITALNCIAPAANYCSVNYTASPPVCSSTVLNPGACGLRYNSSYCAAGSCYWDTYLNACFDSVAQTNALTSCSYWNSYNPNPNPCLSHYCFWSSYSLCTSTFVPTPAPPASVLGYSRIVTFQNPRVLPNSLIFLLDVSVPLSLDMTRPYTSLIGIGNYVSNSYFSNTNIKCTSAYNGTLGPLAMPTTPSVITLVNNSAALNNYYISTVNSTFNYSFAANNTNNAALKQFFGNYLNINSNDYLFKTVYVSSDSQNTIYTMQADLNWLYNNCATTRANTFDNSIFYYNIPVTWIDVTKSGTLYYNNNQFQVGVVTAGVYSFVPNSILYGSSVSIVSVGSVADGCAAGFERLTHTYQLTFTGIYALNAIVCPTTIADVYSTSSKECYGDYATNVSVPICANNACNCLITMSTVCFPTIKQGLTYSNCSAGATNYSSSFNGYHEFNVNVKECDNGLGNPCQSIVGDTPMIIKSNFSQQVFSSASVNPVGITTSAFLFDYSLYPYSYYENNDPRIYSAPFTTTTGYVQNITINPYAGTQAYDAFALEVQFHANSIAAFPLFIDTFNSNFSISATNRFGNVLNGVSPLGFKDIEAYLLYLPKLEQARICPACPSFPPCGSNLACDGMAIEKGPIFSMFPPQTEALLITISFHFDPTTPLISGRRLLSVSDNYGNNQAGMIQFLVYSTPNDSTLAQTTSAKSNVGTYVGASVGGTAGLFLVAAAAGAYYKSKKSNSSNSNVTRTNNNNNNNNSSRNNSRNESKNNEADGVTNTDSNSMYSTKGWKSPKAVNKPNGREGL